MPSIGGYGAAWKTLAADETLKNIPVIIHSGYEDAGKRKKCLDLGAFAYIVKPFEPEFLVSEVERAIESRNENIMAK